MNRKKKNLLTESEFSEHEEWEEQAHEEKDEYHGDEELRKQTAMSAGNLDMIKNIQSQHKKTLKTKGIGHSHDGKKPTWKDSDKED